MIIISLIPLCLVNSRNGRFAYLSLCLKIVPLDYFTQMYFWGLVLLLFIYRKHACCSDNSNLKLMYCAKLTFYNRFLKSSWKEITCYDFSVKATIDDETC